MDENEKIKMLAQETGAPIDYIKREWGKCSNTKCNFERFASIFCFILRNKER